ncbi:hypothetical protein FIBSPDRAFT_963111 [Athelia psychrophila]|uniref:Uncharacterized protein n=1 Tax=Athelia psychrophila TaxID=1759441 RepID=A0A165ZAN9_9AGAM|nr:hypothetical protein FIBSPDRAFT_963111 [Fibularhizoctonia sp. CBS 109695]
MGLFLGPNVTAVEVDLGATTSTPVQQATALAQIHSLSPNLISLIISDGGLDSDSTLAQELHTLVLNLGRLESVACWSFRYIMNGALLYALACLPALKSIGMLCMEDSAFLGAQLSSRPFCSLVDVHIMIESLGAAAAFTGLMLASPLEELRVQTQNSHSPSGVLDFFSGLKLLENRLRLRCINVTCFEDEPPEIDDEEPPRLDPLVLESLLEYTGLKTVATDLCLSMHSVDDDLLRRMAEAWPHLEHLALGKFHECRWPS